MNPELPQYLGYEPHKRETWPMRYAELLVPKTFEWYQGHWENGKPVMVREEVPAGTTVKIVMVSRFGHVGITTKLEDDIGYPSVANLRELSDLREKP